MSKRKCPYTYPHKSRAAMVGYITSIGGYFDRDSRWPLEFNVSTHRADLDVDNLWKRAVVDGFIEDTPLHKQAFWAQHKVVADSLWTWAVEDAARGLSDDDAHQMLWDGTKLEVEMELRGRGGKHLVLTEFNGYTLTGHTPESLGEELMEQCDENALFTYGNATLKPNSEWSLSTNFVRLLYKYVRQCEVEFTPVNAGKEVEFCAAHMVAGLAEHDVVEMQQRISNLETLREQAQELCEFLEVRAMPNEVSELKAALFSLCLAAGLDVTKLMQEET